MALPTYIVSGTVLASSKQGCFPLTSPCLNAANSVWSWAIHQFQDGCLPWDCLLNFWAIQWFFICGSHGYTASTPLLRAYYGHLQIVHVIPNMGCFFFSVKCIWSYWTATHPAPSAIHLCHPLDGPASGDQSRSQLLLSHQAWSLWALGCWNQWKWYLCWVSRSPGDCGRENERNRGPSLNRVKE